MAAIIRAKKARFSGHMPHARRLVNRIRASGYKLTAAHGIDTSYGKTGRSLRHHKRKFATQRKARARALRTGLRGMGRTLNRKGQIVPRFNRKNVGGLHSAVVRSLRRRLKTPNNRQLLHGAMVRRAQVPHAKAQLAQRRQSRHLRKNVFAKIHQHYRTSQLRRTLTAGGRIRPYQKAKSGPRGAKGIARAFKRLLTYTRKQ